MPIKPVDTVVVIDEHIEAIGAALRPLLPDVAVQMGGPAPRPPFAVIGFSPRDMSPYVGAQWVHISGAGANGMLAALARANMRPALITRTVGAMGLQIGEYVLAYLLADAQKFKIREHLQTEKHWDTNAAQPVRAAGQTALIVGTGGIGSGVAKILSAIGVRCIGVSRSGAPRPHFDSVIALDDLPPEMPDIDLCVSVLPLTEATNGCVNAAFLARFSAALFVNAGRGATVDLQGLQTAIARGHIRRAVLDVFPEEPLPETNALWEQPQITITPHVSGLTMPQDTAAAFAKAYRALQQGQRPDLIVDPEAGY